MKGLVVEGDTLAPSSDKLRASIMATSGGLDRIESNYDAYVLVGMGYSFALLMANFSHHRTAKDWDDKSGSHLISTSFVGKAFDEALASSAAILNIARLRQITKSPLLLVPAPLPAKSVLQRPGYEYWNIEAAVEMTFDFYKSALEKAPCPVVVQPPHTVEDRMFTRDEFSRGAVKISGDRESLHRDDDHHHMNPKFGAESLHEILARNPTIQALN
jgi:hypothetical protein